MAPSYVVRVPVSRGLGPEKEAELPLLIRWAQVRILYVLPLYEKPLSSGFSFA